MDKESIKNSIRPIRRTIVTKYAWLDIYWDHGKNLFANLNDVIQYTAYGGMILVTLKMIFGIEVPKEYLKWFPIGLVILYLTIGYLDIKLFKILQTKNDIMQGILTPFFSKLSKKIDEIHKITNGK